MKKLILIFSLLLALCGCQNYSEHELADYCLKINDDIKSLDFSSAKVNEGKIELYDGNMAPVSEIEFEEYYSDIKILSSKNSTEKYIITTPHIKYPPTIKQRTATAELSRYIENRCRPRAATVTTSL